MEGIEPRQDVAPSGTLTPEGNSRVVQDGDGGSQEPPTNKDLEIRSLKKHLVDNVHMIRKMFSIEQNLRTELDGLERENSSLQVHNQRLQEDQV